LEIEIVPADPAKNYTVFVTSPVAPALRPAAAKALLARGDPPAEQVAFVVSGGPLPRMEMMGGEFCGNAARSFGMLLVQQQGLRRGSVTVSVSGCPRPLTVEADLQAGTAAVDMPLPLRFDRAEAFGRSFPVAVFDGICHAIAEEPRDQSLLKALYTAMDRAFRPDAMGVLFLRRQPLGLTPAVWVRATGTTVWEHSCGSGSVAAALWLALQTPEQSARRFSIAQPGGTLTVETALRGAKPAAARLGGPVVLGAPRRVAIDLG